MQTTTETPNMFAQFSDLMMLDLAHLNALSPENLAMDGEANIESQKARFKRIQRDYSERREQLAA
jgi:hypothetical protein